MTKTQKKAKQVISIEAYPQSCANGSGRVTSQVRLNQWCAHFTWKDWRTLLAQLKTELSQFDQAILALTELARGRGQLILNQTEGSERKQAQR